MGRIGRRIGQLEAAFGEGRRPARSPEYVYARIRQEARESIVESLAASEEPLYRITDNGEVKTTDGQPIDHYGDFIRALDERIAQLGQEIAELEEAGEETDEQRSKKS